MKEGRYKFSSIEERNNWLDKHFKDRIAADQSIFPGRFLHRDLIIKLWGDGVTVIIFKETR